MIRLLHPWSITKRAILAATTAIVVSSTLAGAAERPRIGLVLGGGGARGAAHIGVLEVLKEQRIPVDCVSGTSMGALVAGAFASGLSPEEMVSAMDKANWRDMFDDSPPIYDANPRRKIISRRFIPGLEMGVNEKGVEALPGAVDGQKIKLFINRLVHEEYGESQIENMPISLSIISTDLVTGNKVVFRQGSLTKAMRASMSVPAAMSPVEDDGKLLVDGCLVDNVPIDEVHDQCNPDVVIVVNVGSPLLKAEQIGGIPSTLAQMVNILTKQNVTRSLARLRPDDILIKPELDGISSGDFGMYKDAIKRGRTAAEALLPRLRPLAADKLQYEEWLAHSRRDFPASPPVVNAIEIAKMKRVNPEYVERYLQKHDDTPVDIDKLDADLGRIYGDGEYRSVDYSLLTTRDKNILRVTPLEKSFGPDYMRFGLNMETTGDESIYNFRVAYHKTWLNQLGGEWLTGVQVGNEPGVFTEFYQPLDPKRRFFFEPKLAFSRKNINIYQNNRNLARYQSDAYIIDLRGGINVGLLGPVTFGWTGRYQSVDLEIGEPILNLDKDRIQGLLATVNFDQFDRLYDPRHGWAIRGSYFDALDDDYSKARLDVSGAEHFDDFVLIGRLQFAGSPVGTLPAYDAVALGGFLNLSGFLPEQIIGDALYYGSIRAEYILGQLPIGLHGDMRVGLALETGKVDGRYTETELEGWQNSAAVYLGGETPIGPVYIGFGYAPEGSSSMYLSIGTP